MLKQELHYITVSLLYWGGLLRACLRHIFSSLEVSG